MSPYASDHQVAVDIGREAIEKHLQSIMRAASVRPAELGIQWRDSSEGAWWTLKLRWGDSTFDLAFRKKDVKEWADAPSFTDAYRSEIYRLIDWLVANGERP